MKTFISQVVYPVSTSEILTKLKSIETLKESAKPYIYYKLLGDETTIEEGKTYLFDAKLFGFIPLGKYTIEFFNVSDVRFYSKSTFSISKHWEHFVDVKFIGEKQTQCTHQIDMEAGLLTPLFYFITSLYYKNKERKWKKMFGVKD